MNAPVDLAKQIPPPGWSLQGFSPYIETNGKKTWRTVIGKKAEIHFTSPVTDLYQIQYQYFTVVKPLKITTYLDGRQVDSVSQKVIVNGYGYDIIKLSEGTHVLKFEFNNVREVTSKSTDTRPVPMAFLQMKIGVKEHPVGILGADGSLLAIFICAPFLLLLYRFLLK